MTSANLIIKEYSELSILCWDINTETIDRKSAFHKYVDLWHHVDEDLLSAKEKNLIDTLTNQFGRGFFFPRSYGKAIINDEFLKAAIAETDIDKDLLQRFLSTSPDKSYPGRRNDVQYFWRVDYENFVENTINIHE